jgi:hypothetical protein
MDYTHWTMESLSLARFVKGKAPIVQFSIPDRIESLADSHKCID